MSKIKLKPGDVYVDKSGCICIHLISDKDKAGHTAYWQEGLTAQVYLHENNDPTENVLFNIDSIMLKCLALYQEENK